MIYISGGITGVDNYMENFSKAEKELADAGYDVINPAKVNAQMPECTTYEQYMDMSFTMLGMCDTIYMMKGWENSKGANEEFKRATADGYSIMFQEDTIQEREPDIAHQKYV